MNPYKIFVANEEENKEIQDLFFELSCYWYDCYADEARVFNGSLLPYPRFIQNNEFGRLYYCESHHSGEEINLPKLRDLVVLKRNDVNDATHINTRTNTLYLKQGDNEYYMNNGAWFLSDCPNDLKPIEKTLKEYPSEQHKSALINEDEVGLISGDQAKKAWVNGEKIEIRTDGKSGSWFKITGQTRLGVFDDNDVEFRIKPCTITINGIEVPAPFKPKEGEECKAYYIDGGNDCGYDWMHSVNCTDKHIVWRTEEEIKKVVAAQHKIFGGVK